MKDETVRRLWALEDALDAGDVPADPDTDDAPEAARHDDAA